MSPGSEVKSSDDQPMASQGEFTLSGGEGPGYLERHKSWDEETWTTFESPSIDQSDDETPLEVSSVDQGEAPDASEGPITGQGDDRALPEVSSDIDQGEASFVSKSPTTSQWDDLTSPEVSPGILRSPRGRFSAVRRSDSHIVEEARSFPNAPQLILLCSEALHSEEVWTSVRLWIRNHSDAQIKVALEYRSDPPYRMTALHLACLARPPLDIIEKFLHVAAETVFWADGYGNMPLHYAKCNDAPCEVIIRLAAEQTRLERKASHRSFLCREEGSICGNGFVNTPDSPTRRVAFDKQTSFTSRNSPPSTRPIPDRRHSDAAPPTTPLWSGDDVDDTRSAYSENDRNELPEDFLMFFQASPLVGTLSNWQLQPLDRLDFESEREDVKDAVEEVVGNRLAISFEIVTPNLLSQFLTEGAGRVLHFSCHGHKKALYVEDGWGHAEVLRVKNLRNWIRDGGKRLELVFVSACQSRSIGDYFVQAGTPHVVCCQTDSQELQNVAAVEFERAFYRALCKEKTLQEAFDLAIHQVLTSPAIQEDMREDEARKFALLPEGDNHNVKIFFTKQMKPTSFHRKRFPQNAAFPRCPSRIVGRQIQMYQIICGLQGSPLRLVRVSGGPGVGTETVVQACLEYIAERRSINKFGEIIWLPRRDGSAVSNDFAKLYDECLKEEQSQVSASGSISKGESYALQVVEHFRHRKSKSLLVLDGKDILSKEGIHLLSYLVQTLLCESRHVKIIVLQRPGIDITHPKMKWVPKDVLVPPLDLKDTAELFALSCPHVRNRVCCGVGTVNEFADLIVGGEADCSNGRMSKCHAARYKLLGGGNPKRVKDIALGMSEEDFKKLIEMARCPRLPLPSVKSRVELDRKSQDLNEELARAIESEDFSLAHQIQERFHEMELLRQEYPTLLELEAMADDVERDKDRAIEGNDFLTAGRLHQELQRLEIKIQTERIAKDQSDKAAEASTAPSRVAQGERPALLRSPPSFRNRAANVASVNVDGSSFSTEQSGQTAVTGNILPEVRERDSEVSNSLGTSEGFGDDTLSSETGTSGCDMHPSPRLTLGWFTAADSGVPRDCLEGLDSLPVVQSNSLDAPPKLPPSSASPPPHDDHSELARQQGPPDDRVANHRPDEDKKRSSEYSDEEAIEKHSSRVRPGVAEQPPGDTKGAKSVDGAKRQGSTAEENVDDGVNKTNHLQATAQDGQEMRPGAVPVCGYEASDSGDHHWLGEIDENSVFSDYTSDDDLSPQEPMPGAFRVGTDSGDGDTASEVLAVAEPIEAESEQDRVARLVDEAVNNRLGIMTADVPQAAVVVRPRRRRLRKFVGKLFRFRR